MIKLRLQNYLDRVPELAFAKSYGFPIRVKFSGWSSQFRNHDGREAFEKIVLNFIFSKESHVIENLNEKNCFKTVQKLAKREK